MLKEKEHYRENLAMLMEAFPDKKLLNISEVSKWTGISRQTIKKHYFNDGKRFLTLAELASRIS